MTNQELVASIKRGFANLTRFSGRDSRGQFWPFALFLYFALTAISMVVAMPLMTHQISNFQRIVIEQQEQAEAAADAGLPETHNPPILPSDILPDMTPFFWITGLSTILIIIFLAAAVTRRLHDTERSGFWALLPLPFLVTGFLIFPKIFGSVLSETGKSPSDDFTDWFFILFANNLIYIILVVVLIVFLALPGRAEANRYGPPPLDLSDK